jgi:rhodanese-related sulfurtransferase
MMRALTKAVGQAAALLLLAALAGLALGLVRGTLSLEPPRRKPGLHAPVLHPAPGAPRTSSVAPAPAAPAANAGREAPSAAPRPNPAQAAPQAEAEGRGEAIGPREAQRLLSAGAVALDARRPEDFALGHLPGALSLPVEEFDAHFAQVAPRLSPGTPIVVYCGGGDCTLSHELAATLRQMGYGGAQVLRGGLAAWQAAGLRVER